MVGCLGGKVAKQKHAPRDSSRDLFGMVSLRDPFKRLLVTSNVRGSKGHGLNHQAGASFWWYLSRQEKVLRALAECGKPFVMLLPISVLHVGLLPQNSVLLSGARKMVVLFRMEVLELHHFCQKDW